MTPMWMSLKASHSPSWTIESIICASPIRAPKRPDGNRYGARVMFSIPPATTMSTSPARIICDAIATDLRPDPQSMLIVVAGTSFGIPAPIAPGAPGSARARRSTQPSTTSSTSSPEISARSSAARTACAPSSVAGDILELSAELPTGVRTALTITASSITASSDGRVVDGEYATVLGACPTLGHVSRSGPSSLRARFGRGWPSRARGR